MGDMHAHGWLLDYEHCEGRRASDEVHTSIVYFEVIVHKHFKQLPDHES